MVSRLRSSALNRDRNSVMSAGSAASSANQAFKSRKSRALVDSTEPE